MSACGVKSAVLARQRECQERRKPIEERNWVVVDRNCNYSAFSGYQQTYSAYSALKCNACGARWRTKAEYVNTLDDQPRGERYD